MKKYIALVIIIVAIVLIIIGIKNNKIIFEHGFAYSMGSVRLKIYENGNVYEDREIEEPNHKPNFRKIKKLNKTQINELKIKLNEEQSEEDLRLYINKLVYGDENLNLTSSFDFKIR